MATNNIAFEYNGSFNENCYYSPLAAIMLHTHIIEYWTSVVCHWLYVCIVYACNFRYILLDTHVNKLIDTSQQIKYNLTTNHLEQCTINQWSICNGVHTMQPKRHNRIPCLNTHS